MTKPQSPELARSRLGQTDQDGRELRVDEHKSFDRRDTNAPVPEDNAGGLDAVNERDAADTPDKPDHVHPALKADESDDSDESDEA